jgi:hypothetical protein
MCRTYNKIGSLTTLKSRLGENNIDDFKSLREVIEFQKNYPTIREQTISDHKNLIKEEESKLETELPSLLSATEIRRQQTVEKLTTEIDELKLQLLNLISFKSTNYFKKLISTYKQWNCKRKIKGKEGDFQANVETSIVSLVEEYQIKSERYRFITSEFNEAVDQSAQHQLTDLEKKYSVINELNSYIYGALGEQKVVKTLEALSDEYFLINDFSVSFAPAIYNRKENDYIRSVQIDHILIGPSGVFIIETKNWNQKSLGNHSLRSPVEQIKRTSFALFHLLNIDTSKHHAALDIHHWGDRKIPIKNLIVFTDRKPKEEFQYTKILTTEELLSYVKYFKPVFSFDETKMIADRILKINELNET